MKGRSSKFQTTVGRSQHRDFMLQSRSRSNSDDHEPMIIEYDTSNNQKFVSEQNPIDVDHENFDNKSYTDEFLLIESGNFLLTAPRATEPIVRNDSDRSLERFAPTVVPRTDVPPTVIHLDEPRDAPPIAEGLRREESFDADFQSIEKTYTTYINVAEDQIYPLAWKDFIEVARDDKFKSPNKHTTKIPISEGKVNSSGKNSLQASKNRPPAVVNESRQTSTEQSLSSVTDSVNFEQDSQSSKSDIKKFRLFPNLRDTASRMTKRSEAANDRRRLIEGRKRSKKVKKETSANENYEKRATDDQVEQDIIQQNVKPEYSKLNTAPVKTTNADTKEKGEAVGLSTQTMQSTQMTNTAKSKNITSSQSKSSSNALTRGTISHKDSPTTTEIGSLYELAEKIMGKENTKSKDIDFTKRTRGEKKKKKKKKPTEIKNSSSFPNEYPYLTNGWDLASRQNDGGSKEEPKACKDDASVSYDQIEGKKDVSDTVTVAQGVEAVFSGNDADLQGLCITIENNKKVLVTDDIRQNTSQNKSLATTVMSKSFDDAYFSSVVQSIKHEIGHPQAATANLCTNTVNNAMDNSTNQERIDNSNATAPEPAVRKVMKWFNPGKAPNHQGQQNTNEECFDVRDDDPTVRNQIAPLDSTINAIESVTSQDQPLVVRDTRSNDLLNRSTSIPVSTAVNANQKQIDMAQSMILGVASLCDEIVSETFTLQLEDESTMKSNRRSATFRPKLFVGFTRWILGAKGCFTCAPQSELSTTVSKDFPDIYDNSSGINEIIIVNLPNENTTESKNRSSKEIHQSMTMDSDTSSVDVNTTTSPASYDESSEGSESYCSNDDDDEMSRVTTNEWVDKMCG